MSVGNKVTIGLDIGGTNLKAIALEMPSTQIIKEFEHPSNADKSPDAVREAIRKALAFFTKKHRLSISGIGIGCAGSVAPTGVVRNSPNFKNWKNIPLKAWVEEDFNIPTTVDNDANCAAYTEWKVGAGKEFNHVLLLTLGTGLGGGIIINNELLRGSTGTAGEIGHFSIHTDGIDCPCGNRGCFERYCSASALEARLPGVSAKDIFEGASKNPEYKKIVAEFMYDLKVGVTSLANIFDPEAIIFGGGIAQGVAPYMDELHEWLKEHAFPAVGIQVKLLLTQYGMVSGALGAALIAYDQT